MKIMTPNKALQRTRIGRELLSLTLCPCSGAWSLGDKVAGW